MGFHITVLAVALVLAGYLALRARRAGRLDYIQSYEFHPALARKIREKYPHLSEGDVETVFRALRDYFHICNLARNRMVSMPSQVVDVAWHEFILFTRTYEVFCRKAIGRFLHHTPTEAMRTPTLAQQGIKRAWRLACAKENIRPSTPSRLPLLFAIDGMLNIEDGFTYSLNCTDKASPLYDSGYCAGHIGCAAGCAGDSGGGSDSGSGGGFFDGWGGDSSGCGGGCGGGGD